MSDIVKEGAVMAMQESISALRNRPLSFTAHVYSPYQDERYAEYDIEATNQGIAMSALTDPMDGVFFPDFGDKLLSFEWENYL